MSDAQHFAEDSYCYSVFSSSSENNQYHQVSSWNGAGNDCWHLRHQDLLTLLGDESHLTAAPQAKSL